LVDIENERRRDSEWELFVDSHARFKAVKDGNDLKTAKGVGGVDVEMAADQTAGQVGHARP
jgi:hypothetical protein